MPGPTRCKPSSVPPSPGRGDGGEGHFSRPALADELLPPGRRTCPAAKRPTHDCWPEPGQSLLGLAPGGVCLASRLTVAAVRSYRTISPLPAESLIDGGSRRQTGQARPAGVSAGGIFSVALSLSRSSGRWALPTTAVQWCSDFPPPAKAGSGLRRVGPTLLRTKLRQGCVYYTPDRPGRHARIPLQ